MKPLFLAALLGFFPLFATVTLINDSVYPLKAIIYNAQGEKIDEVVLQVNEQVNWYISYSGFKPNPAFTQTPYTVTFVCYNDPLKEERQEAEHQELKGEYSNDTQVAVSAMITANTCPNGPKSCQIIKKKKGEKVEDSSS